MKTVLLVVAVSLATLSGCATREVQTSDANGNPVTVRSPLTSYDLGRFQLGGAQRMSQADVDRCGEEGEAVFWSKLGNTAWGSFGVASPLAARAFDQCMVRRGYRLVVSGS